MVLTARWHTAGDIVGAIVGTTLGIVDAMLGMLGTVGIMPGTLVTDKSSEVAAI